MPVAAWPQAEHRGQLGAELRALASKPELPKSNPQPTATLLTVGLLGTWTGWRIQSGDPVARICANM